MQENNKRILATGILDESLIQLAASSGIIIDVLPFIDIIYTDKNILLQAIGQEDITNKHIVFTSAHAVKAISNVVSQQTCIKVFCLSGATLLSVQQYLPLATVIATAENANNLARKIIGTNRQEVVFCCSDIRRNDLPDMLETHNIQVREIVAYQTILTPHKVDIVYDGLIFFSPSAVHSYLSENIILNEQVLFAIGDTTATAIQQTGNTSVVSTTPDKQKMIETIVQYYNIPLLNK